MTGPTYTVLCGDARSKLAELPENSVHMWITSVPYWGLRRYLDHPDESIAVEAGAVGACPFSPDGAPVVARVTGRRVPGWAIEHNAAGPLPQSPVRSAEPLEDLVLVPYGCTNLRVTEFPVLGQDC